LGGVDPATVKGMKRLLITTVLLLTVTSASVAESVIIRDVKELVEPSELIARVNVICVVDKDVDEGYSKIAYVLVTDPIMGAKKDVVIALENYDRYVVCPNVRYELGEDVLLFAKRMENGNYETVYASSGKFPIENESVNKGPFKEHQSYQKARAEIERAIERRSTDFH
jgi:hypothetical protein